MFWLVGGTGFTGKWRTLWLDVLIGEVDLVTQVDINEGYVYFQRAPVCALCWASTYLRFGVIASHGKLGAPSMVHD